MDWRVRCLCLAILGAGWPLRAQTDPATRLPISFQNFRGNQIISFQVLSEDPPGAFDVDVCARPHPRVGIRLQITSSIQLVEMEKNWGHPAEQSVVRDLTPDDLETLQKFLGSFQAKGAVPPPALSGHEAIAFRRAHFIKEPNGNLHAEPDRVEFYPPAKEAEQAFVKNFIGFPRK